MRAISFEEAKSGKIKVKFRDSTAHKGKEGHIIDRKGSPLKPHSVGVAVVYDVRISTRTTISDVKGSDIDVVTA